MVNQAIKEASPTLASPIRAVSTRGTTTETRMRAISSIPDTVRILSIPKSKITLSKSWRKVFRGNP